MLLKCTCSCFLQDLINLVVATVTTARRSIARFQPPSSVNLSLSVLQGAAIASPTPSMRRPVSVKSVLPLSARGRLRSSRGASVAILGWRIMAAIAISADYCGSPSGKFGYHQRL
jgi:hypothetical protein